MRMYLCALLGVVALLYACETGTDKAAENIPAALAPGIDIPVPQNAYEVDRYESSQYKRSTAYKVDIDYPAGGLLEFYDREMERLGFSELGKDPFNGWDIKESVWKDAVDSSREGSPPFKLYEKYWTNDDESLLVLVLLMYISDDEDKRDKVLFADTQLMNYGFFKASIDFLDRLDETGERTDFEDLMARYVLVDGVIDFDRAVRENPDNRFIREYRDIVEGNYMQEQS